jgi:hypothetical protein
VWSKALKARGTTKTTMRTARSRESGGSVEGIEERRVSQRQEGNGVGDNVRLHQRRKALKEEPQEWNRHETRPADHGADENVMRF